MKAPHPLRLPHPGIQVAAVMCSAAAARDAPNLAMPSAAASFLPSSPAPTLARDAPLLLNGARTDAQTAEPGHAACTAAGPAAWTLPAVRADRMPSPLTP